MDGDDGNLFRKGDHTSYYGYAGDGCILVKAPDSKIISIHQWWFELINAPKPEIRSAEIPNEIIEYGQRYVWAGVI